jgi:hypothetical protein
MATKNKSPPHDRTWDKDRKPEELFGELDERLQEVADRRRGR